MKACVIPPGKETHPAAVLERAKGTCFECWKKTAVITNLGPITGSKNADRNSCVYVSLLFAPIWVSTAI